jgi:hypothetical protein
LDGHGDEFVTRVADARHTSLGNQRHVALGETLQDIGSLASLVLLKEAGDGGSDAVTSEELSGGAGVFGSDEGHLLEHPKRPQSHLFQIPDRSGHNVQTGQGVYSLWSHSAASSAEALKHVLSHSKLDSGAAEVRIAIEC